MMERKGFVLMVKGSNFLVFLCLYLQEGFKCDQNN